ncbi:MAG: hypothetical protein KGO53_11185 [Alphaproteobacteria bacterium]|nr:hypothetical protein [Alphaproteobacteria bacterium]
MSSRLLNGSKAIVLAVSLLLLQSLQPQAQEAPLRLSSVVHGMAFDAKGQPVRLDARNIPGIQQSMIARLRANLSGDAGAKFDTAAKSLMDKAGDDPGRQNWARMVLIESLNASNKPELKNQTHVENLRLASLLSTFTKDPITAPEVMKGKLPDWMAQLDPSLGFIDRNIFGNIFGNIGRYNNAYVNDCIKQGVPIPPPIKLNADASVSDTAANGWRVATRDNAELMVSNIPAAKRQLQMHSYLEPSQSAGLANKISKMYYWYPKPTATNQGLCIANPIIDDPAAMEPRITAFGIICSSLSKPVIGKFGFPQKRRIPAHACFWDNNGNLDSTVTHSFADGSFLAPPEPLTAPLGDVGLLPDDNRCSECHTGEKAFIIMPDDANAIAVRRFDNDPIHAAHNFHNQSNWFVPLLPSTWPQNVYRAYTPTPADPDPNIAADCGGCHSPNMAPAAGRLPNVVGVNPRDNLYKFCSFMLPNFLTKHSAPDFDTPGFMHNYWDLATPAGVQTLYDSCKTLFPPNPAAAGNAYPHNVPTGPFPADIDTWLSPQPNNL